MHKHFQDRDFEAHEVRELLSELSRRLEEAHVPARIHVFGGSAMAMLFPEDEQTRTTNDIDALFSPVPEVQKIISEMAIDYGLSPTWLNSNGANYLPAGIPQSTERVSVASAEELVSMKLAASREQDLHDLGILAQHAGITSPETLVDIAFDAYGEHSVILNEPREDYLLLARDALARITTKQGSQHK